MREIAISIYRQPKWDWWDFVGFSGPRDGGYPTTYGWSKTGYAEASGSNRSVGARLVRSGSVLEYGTAFTTQSINGQYLQFNNITTSGDKVQIKYDPTKIQRFWYRYAGINQILFDLNDCADLREISLRRNNIVFGDLNLDKLSKLQVFEISRNVSLSYVTFHMDAPITLFYLDDTNVSTSAMDNIILHAYNSSINNGKILNRGIMPSQHLCDECAALIARGWQITTYPVCSDNSPTAWRPIDPYCIEEEVIEPPVEDPNAPPVIGTIWEVGSTTSTITVAWDAATDDKGIANYIIYWRDTDHPNIIQTRTVSGNVTSETFTNMEFGSYYFSVRAVDAEGLYSAMSNTIAVSTSFAPDPEEPPTSGMIPIHLTYATGSVADDAAFMACFYMNSNNGEDNDPQDIYYADADFANATILWRDEAKTMDAPEAYFSDGTIVRYWSGTHFSNYSYTCDI